MPKITALTAQKGNKDRINVFVDDEFFCGISLDSAVRFRVVADKEMTDEELSLLLAESGENELYVRALDYILKSPRTEREITRYLYRRDASPETATRIIKRLKTMNYINDEAYAKMFAEQKSGKLGISKIRTKLFGRGIDLNLIEQSLDIVEDETQEDLARRVADKFLRNRERDHITMQKLYRHLATKGFDFDLCGKIVEEFKKQDEEKMEEYMDKWQEYRRAKDEAKQKKAELRELRRKLMEDE
ncbi:MAG: RecX family transcriptional regulator [Firmicutes bacterium]|nr:RecX family transcriptional regulator [Bacillota bacterium]